MGNLCSSSTMGPDAASPDTKRSRDVEKLLREDEKRVAKEVKILLLGAGESGKTTILKQMKIIHKDGFSDKEKDKFRRQIFNNLCESLVQCMEAMIEWNISLGSQSHPYIELFEDFPVLEARERFPQLYKQAFQVLWVDEGIRKVLNKGNEAGIPENMSYFFNDLDRLFAPDYVPTNQDILLCRGKTTGISETLFPSRNLTYRMFDVGGQRSERKKWIHCFDNVHAVLFLAAISGYDQCLIEDRDSNSMHEACMLFDSIVNSIWFRNAAIIIFLNKYDLFQEKIKHSPISRVYPEYTGPDDDILSARDFFKKKLLRLNRSTGKEIYTHFTTAVDTSLVKVVMISVQDMIISRNLQEIVL